MSKTNVQMQTVADANFVSRVEYLQSRTLNRLSSGSKLLVPSDDPAGVGLAEKMTAQNKRIQAAQTNIQNASSLIQTMDGDLKGINTLLTRMSELAQFAKDPSKNSADTNLYRTEFAELQKQIRNTIGGTTAEIGGTVSITKPLGSYNDNPLFGSGASPIVVATGKGSNDRVIIPPTNLRTGATLSLITQDSSGNFNVDISDSTAIQTLNDAIDQIASVRETAGAVGSRLELAGGALVAEGQSLIASISRIQDVDVATESTRLAKFTILSQSSIAMLSQASNSPKAVLQLLGNK